MLRHHGSGEQLPLLVREVPERNDLLEHEHLRGCLPEQNGQKN
jgi:hypothetical protein